MSKPKLVYNFHLIFNLLIFRKYVQVCVQNMSELCFELSENNLKNSGNYTDLQLVPLNSESQQVKWFINS